MAPKEFVLSHVFENISKIKEGWDEYSDIEEHFGVPWKIGVGRTGNHLSLFLFCKHSYRSEEWSIETERTFKMISVTGKNLQRMFKREYKNTDELPGAGPIYFLKWDILMKDYVINDTIIVQVHTKIINMTGIGKGKLRSFDVSKELYSDVVLIVEDEKFYVSKLFLAEQSSYFEALFLGNLSEWKKNEIKLCDINSKDFQKFLEVLYGDDAIDDPSIEGILLVADMYDTQIVIKKCQKFLLKKSKMTLKTMIVKFHTKIINMTGFEKEKLRSFDVSKELYSDVVLVVEDEKFYVSKLFLAEQSSYFEALFLGNFSESKKNEIKLCDIDSTDFQKFLEVLYGEEAINDKTVDGILNLADMYDSQMVMNKCCQFLCNESKKTPKEKLELSIKFKWNQLKSNCMLKIETVDDIKSVLPGDLSQLDSTSPNALFTLFQKLLTLH